MQSCAKLTFGLFDMNLLCTFLTRRALN